MGTKERGITLIALIITIIVLVILSGIVIGQITGDEGLISSTETATENYVIVGYKEQLEQLVQSIILKDSILGDTTTVTSMAEDMEEESWIKTAVPYEETDDIIVTTTDGYVFQVYYDAETGEKEIKYIGEDDGTSIPTITAEYDKTTNTIKVIATCTDGIEKIELIYKEEVVQTDTSANGSTSAEISFSVTGTGWYEVKATSNSGKTRYTRVRVTSTLTAPTIVVTSSGEIQNGWYGKDSVPVEVTISTEDANAVGIYYYTNLETTPIYVEGTSTSLSISTVGGTVIFAYAVDKNGNESEISNLEVKYDNVKPDVGTAEVTPEASDTGWYTTNITISLNNMTDANSGVAGYYYWEVTSDEEPEDDQKRYVSGTSTTLTVTSEGERIIAFQAVDIAGNVSSTYTLTVKKDSIAPNDFTHTIQAKTTTSITITAGATDDTSGIAGYYYYIDGVNQNSNSIDTTGSYQITGLIANKSYTIYVVAVDNAGNTKQSTSEAVTTNGELLAPTITLSGASQTNGYYTGNVTVTITDSASEDTTGATKIKYTITGAGAVGETTITGKSTTFTITADGTSTITAQVINDEGSSSDTSTQSLSKDATAPSTASLSISSYDTTSITVSASGADTTSGVASYQYQRSTTSASSGFTTISTTTSTSYTYSSLSSGTTYYLRVIVTDNAGNTKTSSAVTQATKSAEKTGTELASEIGNYVDYTPTSSSFTSSSTYSGYSSSQTFTTDETLKWRILFADEDTLTLIADTTANSSFYLSGYQGYNNGVLLMNDACKAMYSNSSLGATARSLDIDDIEAVSSYDKTTYTNYGVEYTYTSSSYTYYPTIFQYEEYGSIGGNYTGTLGQSEQSEYYTQSGTLTASTLKGKWTYYYYQMSTTYLDSTYLELFRYQAGTTTNLGSTYWLASRCVNYNSNYARFGMFGVDSGNVYADDLYYSYNSTHSYGYALRPTVEINLASVTVGASGDGTSDSPYSITAK